MKSSSYIDYASVIKARVSVPSVIDRYMPDVKLLHNRIPCPIHNGTDRNLLLHKDHFYCFVCNEGGDVIRLVRHIFGCDFMTALKRLNDDFNVGLPIGNKPTDADRKRMILADQKRREAERKQQDETDRRERAYFDRLELYLTVCRICTERAPRTPWDEWTPDWCTAMRLRTELREEIEIT